MRGIERIECTFVLFVGHPATVVFHLARFEGERLVNWSIVLAESPRIGRQIGGS
jgi:hypothetical protein